MGYHLLEPFGEWRADRRAALVASVIANVYRSKHREPFTLEDFTLRYGLAEEEDDTDDMGLVETTEQLDEEQTAELMAFVEEMNRAFGGVDRRKG